MNTPHTEDHSYRIRILSTLQEKKKKEESAKEVNVQ